MNYKDNTRKIKFFKHVGILTSKTPLKNHERIALWHIKGGPVKHADTVKLSRVEYEPLLLTHRSA